MHRLPTGIFPPCNCSSANSLLAGRLFHGCPKQEIKMPTLNSTLQASSVNIGRCNGPSMPSCHLLLEDGKEDQSLNHLPTCPARLHQYLTGLGVSVYFSTDHSGYCRLCASIKVGFMGEAVSRIQSRKHTASMLGCSNRFVFCKQPSTRL